MHDGCLSSSSPSVLITRQDSPGHLPLSLYLSLSPLQSTAASLPKTAPPPGLLRNSGTSKHTQKAAGAGEGRRRRLHSPLSLPVSSSLPSQPHAAPHTDPLTHLTQNSQPLLLLLSHTRPPAPLFQSSFIILGVGGQAGRRATPPSLPPMCRSHHPPYGTSSS